MSSPAPPSAVPNNAVAPSADNQAPPESEDCASEPPQSSAALGDADQQAPPQSDECAPEDSDPEDDELDVIDPKLYVPTDLSGLQSYEGYQDVSFESGDFVPPPPPPSYSEATGGDSMEFSRIGNISEAEAREALLEFVSQNSCYGKGAANNMEMSKISPCNALHYVLETFCEGRTTARAEVPYLGGEIDGPSKGAPPMPWDIPCEPQQGNFQQQSYNIPVPHTAEIRTCGLCTGNKLIHCYACKGTALVKCIHCNGRGWRGIGDKRRNCSWCHRRKKLKCRHCDVGNISCPHCAGNGQIVNFIQLTVTYMTYKRDYMLEQTAMPDELVKCVEGEEIFQQTQHQLLPISGFPVDDINDNSQKLIEEEKTTHPMERQLDQRHSLRAVPVTQIDYKFKDKESTFFVYGNRRMVYCQDYPQQNCWGCNIL